MIRFGFFYSVGMLLISFCTQGFAIAQDTPQSFNVKALTGDQREQELSLEELIANPDFKEPTILMFVNARNGSATDQNVVKLAKLVDYVVKTYKEKGKAHGAIIIHGDNPKAKEQLVEGKITDALVAEALGEEDLSGYNLSEEAPVTIVVFTKSKLDEKNIAVWEPEDLKNLDEKGQEMVVQFIGLLN